MSFILDYYNYKKIKRRNNIVYYLYKNYKEIILYIIYIKIIKK
jgi:hypothetical protein